MKLILIYGAIAVGKLTTAQALAELTGYNLLHNHMTIDLALSFFEFNSEPFKKLIRQIRLNVIESMLKADKPGLILTAAFPNHPDVHQFYNEVNALMQAHKGQVYYIKLTCTPQEQAKRVLCTERHQHKKLTSVHELQQAMQVLDFSTQTPIDQTLVIENSNLTAAETASKIAVWINRNSTPNSKQV